MAGIAYGDNNAPGLPPVNLPTFDDGSRQPLRIVIHPPQADSGADFWKNDAVVSAAAPKNFWDSDQVVQPAGPQVSTGEAAFTGFKSGLTAGFSDELSGLRDAGLSDQPDAVRTIANLSPLTQGIMALRGISKIGAEKLGLLDSDTATQAYQAGRDRVRALQKAAQEQHPIASGVGELTGALATIPVLPGASLLKVPAAAEAAAPLLVKAALAFARTGAHAVNSAATGAAYAGLSGAGEGEGAQDTATKALKGMESGALLGGGGSLALAPAVGAVSKGAKLIAKPFAGAVSKDTAAAKIVADAFAHDRPGTTLDNVANALESANQAGEPIVAADLGAKAGRVAGTARSAANTSPEARKALEAATGPRFLDQGQRVADDIRWIVGGDPEAFGAHEAIRSAGRTANKPMYARAYAAGDRPVMSPELEHLTGSPAVVDAMRSASAKGKDVAISEGFGAFNSGVKITDDGRVIFAKGKGGVPTYPNIQYWDYVQRELSDAESAAIRGGRKQEAKTLGGLRRSLNAALDKEVPLFGQARTGAARFFKADDMLTAGEEFIGSGMSNAEAKAALAKASPAERQLFAYGFAASMLKAVNKIALKERSTITSRSFLNSPEAKQRIETALGPDGARRLESRVRLETMMEAARAAISSGSSTARQLAEAGLASGIGYGILSGDHDISHVTAAAVIGGMLRAGHRQINANVARRVGELLASNNPDDFREAAKLVAKNPRVMDGVRRTDAFLSRIIGVTQPDATRLLPAPMQGRADEQKQPVQ